MVFRRPTPQRQRLRRLWKFFRNPRMLRFIIKFGFLIYRIVRFLLNVIYPDG